MNTFTPRLRRVLAALLCAAAVPCAAASLYEVTEIGAAGYSFSEARAINALGQVAGTVWNTTEAQGLAFVWDGLGTTVLGTLGGTSSQGRGINDAGLVVGNARNLANQQRGFLWDGVAMSDLGTLGGTTSSAAAINNAGQVAGTAALAGGDSRAYRWQAGVMTNLGTLGGDLSAGFDINQLGEVVGHSGVVSDPYTHTFLYGAGPMVDLGTRETPAINDLGQLTGGSYSGFGPSVAFLYDAGTTTPLGTLGGDSSRGRGINNAGQIVGEADDAGDVVNAFVYEGGVMSNLNDQLAPYAGPAWHLRVAYAINESGWIVGVGERDGSDRAFLLRPVPEPATGALMLLGGGACLVAARRRRRRLH